METVIANQFVPNATRKMLQFDHEPYNCSLFMSEVYNHPILVIKKVGKILSRHCLPPKEETRLEGWTD